MASIQAISQDLKLAPNESLQENPNTLAVLKPLSSSAKHSQASGEEEVRNTAEARVKVTTSLDFRTQSSAAAPSGEDPSGVPAAQRRAAGQVHVAVSTKQGSQHRVRVTRPIISGEIGQK